MRSVYFALLSLLICLATTVRAETFQLADGTTITGEIIPPPTADGLNIKIAQGKYQRVSWTNFAQSTLQELVKDPKLAPFAEPFIEITEEEKLAKTEVKTVPPPRLERPARGSLFGALASSSVGLVVLLLIYAANIYAAYEIATVRAYSPIMVCGIAAVAPVVGPIVFLCLPTKMKSVQEEEVVEEAAPEAPPPGAEGAVAGELPADGTAPAAGGLSIARAQHAAPSALPETQVFKRGQFTFNRRFIETKFAGFFGITRRDADKDMLLIIKSARGEFAASRITRIAASDMHLEVRKGAATSEVQVPFVEIQEIQLKHKDA